MEEWENEKNQSVRIAASCVSSDGCLSSLYLLIGWFCRSIPHILLFCLIALFTMIPIELGFILYDSKREDGRCSLKSALVGQEKSPLWQMILYAAVFFGVAGLASVFIQPVELNLLSGAELPAVAAAGRL